MIEPYPLTWPEGWPRTLLRDRRDRKAWKDTLLQSAAKLRKELVKSKVLSSVISCNIPPNGEKFMDVPAPMTKPRSIQSIVGKTVKAVRVFDDSEPGIEIEFTDGTRFGILDVSKAQLEWAYFYGRKDDECIIRTVGP